MGGHDHSFSEPDITSTYTPCSHSHITTSVHAHTNAHTCTHIHLHPLLPSLPSLYNICACTCKCSHMYTHSLILLHFGFICLCVCLDVYTCVGMLKSQCTWRSEDDLRELVLSVNHAGSGDGTRFIRLGSKHLNH